MKLSDLDSFKVFVRFLIIISGYGFAVIAWGPWWFLWYTLILLAAVLIARGIRIKTKKDKISMLILVLPGTIIAEIAIISWSNIFSKFPENGIEIILFAIFYLGISIFAITNLEN